MKQKDEMPEWFYELTTMCRDYAAASQRLAPMEGKGLGMFFSEHLWHHISKPEILKKIPTVQKLIEGEKNGEENEKG